jgi:hypothetical protein
VETLEVRQERRRGGMDRIYAEESALQRQISEAGWHILRDKHVPDGYVVEFQQGPPDGYHLRAPTWTSTGRDRIDAYRQFLEELAKTRSGG